MREKKLFCRLIDAAVLPDCKTSVVVPVRDEAETLPETLDAFAAQISLAGKSLDRREFEIIFLANNCTDDSVQIIKKFRSENPTLQIHLAEISLGRKKSNIGFVRRLLKNEAHRRLLNNESGGGVIMTSDADTYVAPDWIAANLREIETGAEAVGGRIIIAADELEKMDAVSRKFHLADEEYRLLTAELENLIDYAAHDCDRGRHHQHFNASFAVTTEAYRRAGGVPKVKFLEDAALYAALLRVDARFRHSPRVRVFTSARRVGRCRVGLSNQLNEWKKIGESGAEFLVEAARTVVEKFELRKRLRLIWRQVNSENSPPSEREICGLAERFFVSADFLLAELAVCQPFGGLYENVLRRQHEVGEWRRNHTPAPLFCALEDLRQTLPHFRQRAKSAAL